MPLEAGGDDLGLQRISRGAANQRLCEKYGSAWQTLVEALPVDDGLSNPLFLSVPARYSHARIRLMVVGQETNGWGTNDKGALGEPLGTDPVRRLMAVYDEFNFGQHYVKSPFWQASHELYRSLNPSGPDRGFLWSNLVKVDQRCSRPDARYEEIVASLGLLEYEIQTLLPRVIVFFTGPYYEERLRRTFPGNRIEEVAPFIARVHLDCPDGAIAWRTYHPSYLRRARHWHVLSEIVSRTLTIIGDTAESYRH